MEVARKIQILKSIDILSFLHEATLERLAEESLELTLHPREVLFNEGEDGKTMYIILDGEVRIYKKDIDITTMGPGSIFGEMALIEKQPRSASAEALGNTELIEINEEQFQRYFAGQPQVLMALMKTMSARFRRSLGNPATTPVLFDDNNDPQEKLDHLEDPVFLVNANTFKVIKGSPPTIDQFGYSREEVSNMSLLDYLTQLDEAGLRILIAPLLNQTRSQSSTETELKKKNGETMPVEIKIRTSNGNNATPMVMAWVSDISGRKHIEDTIRQMAYYDSLTGLPNRNLLNDRLAVALARARRNGEKVAIMFLDLDNFKTINDTLGHDMGDLLLKDVSNKLQNTLRQEDTVARMGGDEFIVVAPEIKSTEDAGILAQKILLQFEEAIVIENQELFVGCSIGISTFPEDGSDSKTLLKNADMALYRAKDRGKNNFQLYTPALNFKAMERMAIEKNLRKAVEREEFDLVFQPKVELATGKIVGMEGLVRWDSPELGRVMPVAFIPVAEDTRIIVQIGAWTLKRACQQIRQWMDAGLPPISIAINLSGVQFAHPQLLKELQTALQENDVSPDYLQLEITETILMKDTELAVEILRQLGELGIKAAIDDFGTGYSSLNYLKNLPIHYLKIDRTFVRDFSQATNSAITKTIVGLGKSLGLKTIAEGIETEEQKQFLLEIGCEEGQGYLFSPPVSSQEVTQLLMENKVY